MERSFFNVAYNKVKSSVCERNIRAMARLFEEGKHNLLSGFENALEGGGGQGSCVHSSDPYLDKAAPPISFLALGAAFLLRIAKGYLG